jgi:hypothetical protein
MHSQNDNVDSGLKSGEDRSSEKQVIVMLSTECGQWRKIRKIWRRKGRQREEVFDETARACDFCFVVNAED